MNYHEIKPGGRLQPYVKCYYTYECSAAHAWNDTVFPSGCMELIFNLGEGQWQTAPAGSFVTTPPIEFWGQIVKPLPVKSIGKQVMLGVRFYPQAAAHFVHEKIDLLNNQVTDYSQMTGAEVKVLYGRLQETSSWPERIQLLEAYLLGQLRINRRKPAKMAIVNNMMTDLQHEHFFDNIENLASRYGITSRYMQKLFLENTGLTPKLYSKINRFQNSLRLVTQKQSSLTSIAYECGYFDQSHFIRDFKAFTGTTPSSYSFEASPVTLAVASN